MSEIKPLAIYNCQTCMFITKNKKDYERHIQSKKHQDSCFQPFTLIKHEEKEPSVEKPPVCPNCNKLFKSRTYVYTHMKKCGNLEAIAPSAHPAHPAPEDLNPESLTPEQIRYILIENKILKELLKTAIHAGVVASAPSTV